MVVKREVGIGDRSWPVGCGRQRPLCRIPLPRTWVWRNGRHGETRLVATGTTCELQCQDLASDEHGGDRPGQPAATRSTSCIAHGSPPPAKFPAARRRALLVVARRRVTPPCPLRNTATAGPRRQSPSTGAASPPGGNSMEPRALLARPLARADDRTLLRRVPDVATAADAEPEPRGVARRRLMRHAMVAATLPAARARTPLACRRTA